MAHGSVTPRRNKWTRHSPRKKSSRRASALKEDEDTADALDDTQLIDWASALVQQYSATNSRTFGLEKLKDTLLAYAEEGDEMGSDEDLELDWDMYRMNPLMIRQEELSLQSYFDKLERNHLELETKVRLLAGLEDHPETGLPAILTLQDGDLLDRKLRDAERQLQDAQRAVRDLREEVDTVADNLVDPFSQMELSMAQVTALVREISEMEAQLAEFQAAEEVYGSMTLDEAQAFCEEQMTIMEQIAEEIDMVDKNSNSAQNELGEAQQSLARLEKERAAAEKMMIAAQLGKGHHRGRDFAIEQQYARHVTTLDALHDALGIDTIVAPSDTELHITLVSPEANPTRRRSKRDLALDDDALSLVLEFDAPGGAIQTFRAMDASGNTVDVAKDVQRAALDAVHRNDAAGVVQALWSSVL